MTRRRHHKSLTLIMVCILLFSAAGLSACARQALTTPTTEEEPAVTEEKTAPPEEKVVTEGKPTPTQESTPQQEPAPQQEPTSMEVDIAGFSFAPATITVLVGTTITWTNQDSVFHTVTAQDKMFDSGSLSSGDTFNYTFEQKETFEYYCVFHPYMKGKVAVE